jgi:sortase (surface protein transpeptidase)
MNVRGRFAACSAMKKVISSIVLIVTIIAGIVFFGTLVRATIFSPEFELTVPDRFSQTQTIPPEEQPLTLEIPKIEISTDIQYVGINGKGNMGVPSNYSDVAWFKYGTVPGQIGSAVIDGHVDNGLGLPGVFKRLHELQVGDDVYVVTKEGRRLHFVIMRLENYGYKEVPVEELFNRSDAAYLNLITCGGAWVKSEKTYDQRLVVYTRLVND